MKQRWLSVMLLVGMLLAVLVGAVGCGKKADDEAFDYLAEDLSPYISIDASKYTDLKLALAYDYVTVADVQDWIYRIFVSYRADKPLNDGAGITDAPITLGDEVYVYYRGYYLDEGGKRVYISGGSNTADKATKITVGKMDNVSGFETSLLGLVPSEMTTLKNTGRITEGDCVTASYFVLYPDKSYATKTETFLFSSETKAELDARFGEGFYDMLASEEYALEYGVGNEKALVSSAQFPYTSEVHGTGKVSYQDMTFLYGTSDLAPAVVATTYFPATMEEESLRCKTVYFDMYLDATRAYVVQYETPELNDAFILEQKEISIEELLEYEGDTLTEQYRAVVRELLEGSADERALEYDTLVYDAVYDRLLEATKVVSYPEAALEDVKGPMRAELELAFAEDGATYGYTDKEAFAKALFGYRSGTFEEYIDGVAKETVHSRLAFYGIAKKEGALPTEEQKIAKANELKQTYFSINLNNNKDEFDRDKFESDAAHQAAIDAYFKEMMEYYGEEYFLAEAEYFLVMEHLSRTAEITVLGRKD